MFATFVLVLAAQAAAVPSPMPTFLAGCWEHRAEDRWTEECWTGERAGQMMGSSRSGIGDKIDSWEFMRIERSEAGVLTFYASPGGAPPTAFPASSAGPDFVEFTNPANEYPQRIRYARSVGGVDAEISLIDGSKPARWTYRPSGLK